MYVKCKMMIRKYELDHSFQINKAITLLPPIVDIRVIVKKSSPKNLSADSRPTDSRQV